MTSLATLVERHGLAVAVEPADANPDMPNSVPGMTHWSVSIDGDAPMPVAYSVSLLRENGDPAPPSVEEALGFLQADLAHPGFGAEDEDWLRLHGIAPGSEAAAEWLQARDRLSELGDDVASFLPPEVSEILLGGRRAPIPAPMLP